VVVGLDAPVAAGPVGQAGGAGLGGGLPAAQHLSVVDAVPTRQHPVDQGRQLAAGPMRASPPAQIDQRIGGLLDAQPLGQGTSTPRRPRP
jgi:hypothetical protein